LSNVCRVFAYTTGDDCGRTASSANHLAATGGFTDTDHPYYLHWNLIHCPETLSALPPGIRLKRNLAAAEW
jgi:hypothetical protein